MNFLRRILIASLILSFLLIQKTSLALVEEREGIILPPGGSWTAEELAEAIVSPSTKLFLIGVSKSGAETQFEVYTTPLQNFPTEGTSYIVISSGKASEIGGEATTFYSHSVGGGDSEITGQYSHRGNYSYDIARLSLTFTVPANAISLTFDWKFATEENPTYTSSFRDWAKAIITTSSGSTNILLLPNGNPVDVYNASFFSNSVTGSSGNPLPPYPTPNDVVYNAVTEMYTASFDLSPYAGETITLDFWVGDENDGVLDSALLIDNLRIICEASIWKITPNEGGNTGVVTTKIYGAGLFDDGLIVKLTRDGYEDILAEEVTLSEKNLIIARFDLTGKEPGKWDVVVILPDETELRLEEAFTILSGGEPSIVVEIIGRDQIRVGTTGNYFVRVYNQGKVDAYEIMLDLDIPEAFKLLKVETMDGIVLWDREKIIQDINEGMEEFPEDWEEAPEGIVEEFLNKGDFILIPFIESGGYIDLKLTLYAKLPWADEDPILTTIAIGLAKTVGWSFMKHFIAQGVGVIIDEKDQTLLGGLWESFKEALKRTKEEILSWGFWGSKARDKWLKMILEEPEKFVEILKKSGVPEEKAISITNKLFYGLQEKGVTLTKLKILDKLLVGVNLTLEIYEKWKKANEEIEGLTAEGKRDITPVWAWDPNVKVGPTGYGPEGFISPNIELQYIIYFENLAEATAEAQNIVITDILDPNLDWSTLSIGEVSHPEVMNWKFDPSTGVITWTFTNINLPPNKTPPEGEGWVKFSIKPKKNLASGTKIENKAIIVFDFNPPMETKEVINIVDASPPNSSVDPLPESSPTSFTVSWSGDDGEGSGIRDFTIYVSENGGPWTPWLINTSLTSATFTGKPGSTYAFYSIAHDNVGNIEPQPLIPDATTTILMLLGDLDNDGDIDLDDYQIFRSSLGKCEGDVGFISEADYDKDGCVTYLDYRIWYGYYKNQ